MGLGFWHTKGQNWSKVLFPQVLLLHTCWIRPLSWSSNAFSPRSIFKHYGHVCNTTWIVQLPRKLIVGIKLTSYYNIPCFCLRCLSPKQNDLPNFILQNKKELVISWIMWANCGRLQVFKKASIKTGTWNIPEHPGT